MQGPTSREHVLRPFCPFCGREIAPPRELALRRPLEMPVGGCPCGAVYAYDASGKNLGAAFVEALVFACGMDWDLAWDLLPGEDYREKVVEGYDGESHLLIPGGYYLGRRVKGALYFVRLAEDVQEVVRPRVERAVKEFLNGSPSGAASPVHRPAAGKTVSKRELEAWVRDYRVEEVLEAVARDRKVLWHLRRLLAAGEEEVRLRAAELLGRAVSVVAAEEPGRVAELLKSFLYSLEDAGSFNLGVVDALGEIIARFPDRFAGYLPPLLGLLKVPSLQARAVRALALVAGARPELLRKYAGRVQPLLAAPEPEVRGHAALFLGLVGHEEAREELSRLKDDAAEVPFYREGKIFTSTVGRMAKEALARLRAK